MKDIFMLSSMFPAIPMSQTTAHHTATALKNNLFSGPYGNTQPNLLRHVCVQKRTKTMHVFLSYLSPEWKNNYLVRAVMS